MFARQLVSSPRSIHSSPSVILRLFASSQCLGTSPSRSPSLGDITPDRAHEFDARQKDFRAKTAAANKAKDQRHSQSTTASSLADSSVQSHDSARRPGSTGASTSSSVASALGSLSTQSTGDELKAAKDQQGGEAGGKRKGALSSLIYGTAEGQQMDQEIEKSFSQVLARGKYVHSIVFHEVKPDKVDEYVELVGQWYPKVASMPENKVHLVGSWRTEVGDCDTFGMSHDGP